MTVRHELCVSYESHELQNIKESSDMPLPLIDTPYVSHELHISHELHTYESWTAIACPLGDTYM